MTRLADVRRDARETFSRLGFPTTKDEEWRFTNVAPIARTNFKPAQPVGVSAPEVFRGDDTFRLVFVNGHLVGQVPELPIRAGSLRQSMSEDELAENLILSKTQPFVALNTAEFSDGAFVEVPRGFVLDRPLHLVFVSTGNGSPTVSHPRNVVRIGPKAQATIIETYVGAGEQTYFTNTVTEIHAGEASVVDHYRFQDERVQSFHVGTLDVRQARDSSFTTSSFAFGGALVRNDVNAVLSEGAECTLNGLYLVSGRQHVDNHTTIDHAKPHAASHEFYKGILDGRSSAVFNGKIIVRQDAQKTDAKQTNKNLVLSEDATINTKPELQIFADDVRCTHGATVGQLDPEALFYLRSRGIGAEEARDFLTLAFARDVIDRVKVDVLREHLAGLVLARLSSEAS
jgi:Fe-S cluster assembly protein SufD